MRFMGARRSNGSLTSEVISRLVKSIHTSIGQSIEVHEVRWDRWRALDCQKLQPACSGAPSEFSVVDRRELRTESSDKGKCQVEMIQGHLYGQLAVRRCGARELDIAGHVVAIAAHNIPQLVLSARAALQTLALSVYPCTSLYVLVLLVYW